MHKGDTPILNSVGDIAIVRYFVKPAVYLIEFLSYYIKVYQFVKCVIDCFLINLLSIKYLN